VVDDSEACTRMVVYLTEDDLAGHHHLHEVLVRRARAEGLAGATVWRAVEGLGRSGHVRAARFPDSVTGLPVAVEIVDLPDRVEAFLTAVRELAPGALVTREPVRRYGRTP
jgi:PII-like signaling protein